MSFADIWLEIKTKGRTTPELKIEIRICSEAKYFSYDTNHADKK